MLIVATNLGVTIHCARQVDQYHHPYGTIEGLLL